MRSSLPRNRPSSACTRVPRPSTLVCTGATVSLTNSLVAQALSNRTLLATIRGESLNINRLVEEERGVTLGTPAGQTYRAVNNPCAVNRTEQSLTVLLYGETGT